MSLREKLVARSQPFLEPGEQIQATIPAQTTSQWWILLGIIPFMVMNHFRLVVATDRRILVLDTGKWSNSSPKSIVAVVARQTQIGPPAGVIWYACNTLGPTLRIHRRFHSDVRLADEQRASADGQA